MVQPLRGSRRASGTTILFAGTFTCASILAAVAQPLAVPRSPAVNDALREAREFAYDLEDAPCDFAVRIQVQAEANVLSSHLSSLIADARRDGRQSDAAELERASRNLGNEVEDYFEDCGGPGIQSGYFYIPGTETAIQINGYVRYEERFVGDKIGVGVVQTQGDPFFTKQSNSIGGAGLGAAINYNTGQWQQSFGLKYRWGDETANAHSPGGMNIGYVPGDTAFGNGVVSNLAFTGRSEVSLKSFGLQYSAMRQFNLQQGFNWGWTDEEIRESEKRLGWTATIEMDRLKHDGRFFLTDFPNNLNISIDQKLNSYSFMAGPAIGGRRLFGGGFYLFGYADFQAGVMYSKLDSREDIFCNVCGGALPQLVDINDSRTDFTWRASGEIGAGFMVTRNFDVKATAGLQVGRRHMLDVRRNPTDESTHIGTDTGFDWSAGLKGHLRF